MAILHEHKHAIRALTMKPIAHVLLALAVAAMASNGNASGSPSGSEDEQLEANVKALVSAQVRVLSRAAAFCTAKRQPPGRPLDQSLEFYIKAFSAGTKAGMMEISKTDKDILSPSPAPTKKDLEMMDMQGDMFLSSVQPNPEAGCKKLAEYLDSGTLAAFKETTVQSHREYTAKRAEYCAKVPKPRNCQ